MANSPVLTPFRAGTDVVVTQRESDGGSIAYDFVVYGAGDYTVVSAGEGEGTLIFVDKEVGTVRIDYGDYIDIYENLLPSSLLVQMDPDPQVQVKISQGTVLGAAGSNDPKFTKLRFERYIAGPNAQPAFEFVDDQTPLSTTAGETWSSTTQAPGLPHTPRTRGSIDLSSDLRTNSLAFDANYYLNKYQDLQAEFGGINDAAAKNAAVKNHWLQYGISEGRRGSSDFDSFYYLQSNPDIADNYGPNNYAGAISHFLNYGINEQRQTNEDFIPIYYMDVDLDFNNNYGGSLAQMLTSPAIFNANYYLSIYSDVAEAYGATNVEGAKAHWLQYGISESRRGSEAFNPIYYLASNIDVANAFGSTNYEGAIYHWMTYGIDEGRQGSLDIDAVYYLAVHSDVEQAYGERNFRGALFHYYQYGSVNKWKGNDELYESSTFDASYYVSKYSDVASLTAGPNQVVAALRHFYYIGIEKGMRGSGEFDAKYYLAANPDVRNQYGSTNYRAALEHYVTTGKAQGRAGADDSPLTYTITDQSIVEGDSGTKFLQFKVTLNHVFGDPLTVNYETQDSTAEAGSDYIALQDSLVFQPGDTEKEFQVEIIGDTDFELDETFKIILSDPNLDSNGNKIILGLASGVIKDNDRPVITLEAPSDVKEDSGNSLTYTFKRSGPITDELIVNYTIDDKSTATFGSDYTTANFSSISGTQTIKFAANSDTTTVTLSPSADSISELDETVTLILQPATNGSDYVVGSSFVATGTILNDDLPIISVSVSNSNFKSSIPEDSATSIFTFNREGYTGGDPLTVYFTIDDGIAYQSDYNQTGAQSFASKSGSVIFATGSTSTSITITPISDNRDKDGNLSLAGIISNEPDKVLKITLGPDPSQTQINYKIDTNKASANVTIVDDDVSTNKSYAMIEGKDSTLVLTGTGLVDGLGNSYDNIIKGNASINSIEGGPGADLLDGGGDQDYFVYNKLTDSQLGTADKPGYDTIINFNQFAFIKVPIGTVKPSQGYLSSKGPTLPITSKAGLTEAAIQTLLGPNLAANAVTSFAVNASDLKGTFLVINDATAGFQASNDGLIFFDNYNVTLASPIRFL